MLKTENMKKQFRRVKQIANQTVGRTEKSEVLSQDLCNAEKRVNGIKTSCQIVSKKLQGCLTGTGTELEKRNKKMTLMQLGQSMIESSALVGSDSIFGRMLQICGDTESQMANLETQYEINVDQGILLPLAAISDNENFDRVKRKLSKAVLDMDSARNRLIAVQKTSIASPAGLNTMTMKSDVIQDELDDCSNKVDQYKDQLATEIFSFIGREAEFSRTLLELAEMQATFHQSALDCLQNLIPAMKCLLEQCPLQPVYGCPLEDHLRLIDSEVAQVLEECVSVLVEKGIEEEGLFRIAGSASRVKKLRAAFDSGHVIMSEYETDVHAIAGCLKQYLRELPEPLMTFHLYDDWLQASSNSNSDTRLQALWCVVSSLPKPNFDNLRYLVRFLHKITESSEINKMTASNLALVIGPNIIWSEQEGGVSMLSSGIQAYIVESLIQHAMWFFPGEIEFGCHDNVAEMPDVLVSTPLQRRQSADDTAPPTVTVQRGSSPPPPSHEPVTPMITSKSLEDLTTPQNTRLNIEGSVDQSVVSFRPHSEEISFSPPSPITTTPPHTPTSPDTPKSRPTPPKPARHNPVPPDRSPTTKLSHQRIGSDIEGQDQPSPPSSGEKLKPQTFLKPVLNPRSSRSLPGRRLSTKRPAPLPPRPHNLPGTLTTTPLSKHTGGATTGPAVTSREPSPKPDPAAGDELPPPRTKPPKPTPPKFNMSSATPDRRSHLTSKPAPPLRSVRTSVKQRPLYSPPPPPGGATTTHDDTDSHSDDHDPGTTSLLSEREGEGEGGDPPETTSSSEVTEETRL